jgi:outer membrane protein assembly factor BamB
LPVLSRSISGVIFLGTLLSTLPAFAADWSSFRGPNASGVAETSRLPVEFGPSKNVLWKAPLPMGKSSPALTRDRIFLTASEGDKLQTFAVDRETGAVVWHREIPRERAEQLHQLNHPASATPATDGENVYAFFGDFGLVSYGPDGNERWRMPLGPFSNLHGMAASPILEAEKLIVVSDQDVDSYVMAVHKDTGKMIWKTPRPEVVHGFATPAIFRPSDGPPQVVVPGSYQLIGYSLDTGEKLRWVRGLTWQVKPAAVVAGDTVFATGWAPGVETAERRFFPPFDEAAKEADPNHDNKVSPEELPEKWKPTGTWRAIDLDRDGFLDPREWGFYIARRAGQNATIAVRPGRATGELTESHVAWQYSRNVPEVPSPVVYDGVFYSVKDGGILSSLDARSGEELKLARVSGAIDKYYASPVAADGKIYLLSETGKLAVLSHGGDWKVLRVNELGEPCYATPAIADGRLYVRTDTMLSAYGQGAESGPPP